MTFIGFLEFLMIIPLNVMHILMACKSDDATLYHEYLNQYVHRTRKICLRLLANIYCALALYWFAILRAYALCTLRNFSIFFCTLLFTFFCVCVCEHQDAIMDGNIEKMMQLPPNTQCIYGTKQQMFCSHTKDKFKCRIALFKS